MDIKDVKKVTVAGGGVLGEAVQQFELARYRGEHLARGLLDDLAALVGVGQRLLRDAAFRPQRAHRRAEGLRQLGIVGGGAGRSAALDGSLLHGQKRQVAAQLKPRYL